MQRILLADDHHIVRQGVEWLIQDLLETVDIVHVSSIQGILEQFENRVFDFAILDAQYPDGNCIDILGQIKKTSPKTKVMVFSSFDEEIYALQFLAAGADGFLSKISQENEIQNALKQLFQQGFYHSSLTQALMKIQQFQPNALNPLQQLSDREFQIAKMYAAGYENLEISNELSIKPNTVSTYKKRIYEKLNIEKLVELIDIFKKYHDF